MTINNKQKNIVVTGANGFVGKNFCLYLKESGYENIFKITRETNFDDFNKYILSADIIFNLAGVNRPKDNSEFFKGNTDFLKKITNILIENKKNTSIMLASSTQASLDNEYGKSKKQAEDILNEYNKTTGAKVYIYRFPNIFGKWSKPNYNSVVATFCYNISRDLPIVINDRNSKLDLVYIDDVCKELLNICNNSNYSIADSLIGDISIYHTTVGELADTIKGFKEIRKSFYTPNLNRLNKYLYSTYLSFLDVNDFSYPLVMHKDERGSFTEILKTLGDGQFSVNIIKPGIAKGGHYHNTKNEKFIVVSGEALIEFTSMNPSDHCKSFKYEVSGEKIEVIDIPCGYAHIIRNVGKTDLITIMWANEIFNENYQDTYRYYNCNIKKEEEYGFSNF